MKMLTGTIDAKGAIDMRLGPAIHCPTCHVTYTWTPACESTGIVVVMECHATPESWHVPAAAA